MLTRTPWSRSVCDVLLVQKHSEISSIDLQTCSDTKALAPSCYEPDPYNIDECFESCGDDKFNHDHWGVSLDEVDVDVDMAATIFTYTVNVWGLSLILLSSTTPSVVL